MRKSIFKRLLPHFSADFSSAFPAKMAETYYLPEGRYYAAPAVYRRRRKNLGLPVILSFGFSLFSLSAVQQNMPLPAPANVTILAALPVLPAAAPDRGAAAASRPAILDISTPADRGLATAAAGKSRREDRLNSGGKGNSVLAQRQNRRPLLVNYDKSYALLAPNSATASLSALLKNGAEQAYAVRFQPGRAQQTSLRMAQGFVPAPQPKAPPVLPVPQMLAALVNNDKPDILALGYAAIPADPRRESPFDSILTDNKKDKDDGRFIPPIGKKDHPWAAMPLPASVFEPKQQKCLAEAVYFEARSESLKGQAAVAQIVLNRVRNPAYPDTVCGVVYQNVGWYNRCQFSFACDGRKHRVTEMRPWKTAEAVAKAVAAGQIWLADIGSATHYHATYVHPYWAGFMDKMQKIGSHVFYRTRGGGWS